ncbi:MAG: hypothetical protein RR923_02975 [Bacilli bacterium]
MNLYNCVNTNVVNVIYALSQKIINGTEFITDDDRKLLTSLYEIFICNYKVKNGDNDEYENINK